MKTAWVPILRAVKDSAYKEKVLAEMGKYLKEGLMNEIFEHLLTNDIYWNCK